MAGKAAIQDTVVRLAKAARKWRVAGMRHILPVAFACVLALLSSARAEPVTGNASLATPGAYARLLLQFSEAVPTEVTVAGTILVVRFAQPVDMPVDQLSDAVPTYVGSVRRDPDGSAIRLALAQKVRVNVMTAGERVFIDLLPETWSGLPPPLPAEVVRELSERAIAAERALRLQKQADAFKKKEPVRVRTSVQPTFVRFVFELPGGVGVSSSLSADKFVLSFASALTFDLADAKVAAPANIRSIGQSISGDNSTVEIGLIGEVDVHGFREERNYIVDIGFDASKKPPSLSLPELSLPPSSQAASGGPPAAIKTPAAALKSVKATAPQVAAPEAAPEAKSPAPADATAKGSAAADRQDKQAASTPDPAARPVTDRPITGPAPAPASDALEKRAAAPAVPEVQAQAAAHEKPASASNIVIAAARRTSEEFRITLPFGAPTASALFRRTDTIWLLLASEQPLDIAAIRREGGPLIADARVQDLPQGRAIRIRLDRPQLASLGGDDHALILSLANKEAFPPRALQVVRHIADPAQANVSIALSRPGPMLRLADPDVGDTLKVVTAFPPAQGFIRHQNFVEFSLLESSHGVVIQSGSDDVTIQIASDRIVLGRPGGLTLSAATESPERAASVVGPTFDLNEWKSNQKAVFNTRHDALMTAAAMANGEDRLPAHLALARFYIARGLYPEAREILGFALSGSDAAPPSAAVLMVRAVANVLSGRPERAMKDLTDPAIGNDFDAQLWQAAASARLGKWAQAREKFKNVEFAMMSQPIDLQRLLLVDAMRAALEVRDYSTAAARHDELQTIGVPAGQEAVVTLLRGRLAQALAREKDALAEFHAAAMSGNGPVAAEAKLLEIMLRQKRGEIDDDAALRDLETLAVTWRGDSGEVKILQILARIYADKGRYGESLAATMTATRLEPDSEASRAMQDAASTLFTQIFLTAKGDELPPVEALAMFYEYRDFTPIGRRGDEMIRRLADRLVAVDLLDQASELLQYQVDHRLEGAARAQVASRLAMIYLMNRKPERAIAALRSTRIADLAGELRQQRLLLEGRAQSDVGRHDLALDIIANISGREAVRLRSDIYWAARRWRESSEQIEILYGERWRDFRPLSDSEKGDVIRATIGYALAEDAIGLARFREKYGPKMDGAADRSAFAIASKPAAANSADFARIAKMAATIDTLDGFLREMKARFPDAVARAKPPQGEAADPEPTGSLPAIVGVKTAPAR